MTSSGSCSEARLQSNRRNALLSTGPRGVAGKLRASKNATRHGLLSREVLLPDEDDAELASFRGRLAGALQPVGDLEEFLADRVVSCVWRLRRVLRLEAGVFAACRSAQMADRTAEESDDLWGESSGIHPGAHDTTPVQQEDERHVAPVVHLGLIYAQDAVGQDVLSKLSRYETTIERSMLRALHELQRLQATRAGERVPAPLMMEVDVLDGQP